MSKPTMSSEEEDARYALSVKPVPDEDLCQARILLEAGKDTRFKPAVYEEDQCPNTPAEGDDLCPRCRKRFNAWAADPRSKVGVHWNNRITEAPKPDSHVLGTEWAKKIKWVG